MFISYTPSQHDGFIAVVFAGLACHAVFRRYEPTNPWTHFVLLAVVPTLLSTLLIRSFIYVFSAIIMTFILYLSTLITSVILYRLSPFHPLAKYPGPVMCRVSKFWMAWISFSGKQHLYYSELHKQYGDVVRIGPNELSICDVWAVLPVMGPNGLPKGPHWDGRMAEQTSTRVLISVRDPVEHARRRRPWIRALSSGALKGYEPIIAKRASQLVTLLEQRGTVDLANWISFFSFDFMSDMAFSGGSEMMRDGDKDGIWHLLESGLPTALILSHLPWLGKYYARLPGIGKDLKKFRTFCGERAAIRRSQGSQVKDLFHHLIDESGFERLPPTLAEVVSDGVLAIVAGSDTTATTLSSLFWCLMCHPTAYRRLQAEVDKFFPPGENALDTSHHPYMHYLNAVINEALRLFPPVLSGSQRSVLRGSGGKAVGPYFLPEGTNAFVHFYSIHRDPRNFSPSPNVFWPERWLSSEERQFSDSPEVKGIDKLPVIHNTSAFMPFSRGPVNCVGKVLAYQEMRMVICLMMQRLDFRFADGYEPKTWEDDLCDFFVATKGSLPVILTPRNRMA